MSASIPTSCTAVPGVSQYSIVVSSAAAAALLPALKEQSLIEWYKEQSNFFLKLTTELVQLNVAQVEGQIEVSKLSQRLSEDDSVKMKKRIDDAFESDSTLKDLNAEVRKYENVVKHYESILETDLKENNDVYIPLSGQRTYLATTREDMFKRKKWIVEEVESNLKKTKDEMRRELTVKNQKLSDLSALAQKKREEMEKCSLVFIEHLNKNFAKEDPIIVWHLPFPLRSDLAGRIKFLYSGFFSVATTNAPQEVLG